MEYKGFTIERRHNWRIGRKEPSVIYGAGNSKTTGYFHSNKIAKLFIDWIVESDYSRNEDKIHGNAFWRYQDALKAVN